MRFKVGPKGGLYLWKADGWKWVNIHDYSGHIDPVIEKQYFARRRVRSKRRPTYSGISNGEKKTGEEAKDEKKIAIAKREAPKEEKKEVEDEEEDDEEVVTTGGKDYEEEESLLLKTVEEDEEKARRDTPPFVPAHFDARKKWKLLGEGSYGQVYSTRERKTGQRVVFKIVPKEHWNNIRNEVHVLNHFRGICSVANIVCIRGLMQDEKSYYVQMEYLEGYETLERYIRKKNGTPAQRVEVGVALVDTVALLHDKGVYHRDLKPDNVMARLKGSTAPRVKIIDFGESCLACPAFQRQKIAGTVFYSPPEYLRVLAEGKSFLPTPPSDAQLRAADYWALGLTLLVWVTLQPLEKLFDLSVTEPPTFKGGITPLHWKRAQPKLAALPPALKAFHELIILPLLRVDPARRTLERKLLGAVLALNRRPAS